MTRCKHCRQEIVQISEKIWHDKGSIIFPQYCSTVYTKREYADLLHEPEDTENRFVEKLEELLTTPGDFDTEKALELSLEIHDAERLGYWVNNYEAKLWLQLSIKIQENPL